MIKNFTGNLCFVLSAMAFGLLSIGFHMPYIVAWLSSCVAVTIVAARIPDIYSMTKNKKTSVRLWALLTSFSIVHPNAVYFLRRIFSSQKIIQVFENYVPGKMVTAKIFSYLLAVSAAYFFYIVMCFLCDWLYGMLSSIFFDCTRTEKCVICMIALGMMAFVLWTFCNTTAFFGGDFGYHFIYDIIYTSDSGSIVKENCYLVLNHMQNDLRQPLFSVFAAPFTGVPYLLSLFCWNIPYASALFIAIAQVMVLLLSYFILAKLISCDYRCRITFLIIISSTYMTILFSVMMEQYIIALFWLILFVYVTVNDKQQQMLVLIGASGTMLTSAAMAVWLKSKESYKHRFYEIIKAGISGLVLIIFFGRLDVILTCVSQLSELSGFTGKELTFGDKVLQYFSFLKNCFLAPDAGIRYGEYITWQLETVSQISLIGITIFLLMLVSSWIYKNDKLVNICFYWLLFSFLIIVIVGWGTAENGTILYSLYFGWSFVVLLFKLIQFLLEKLKLEKCFILMESAVGFMLLSINIPAIGELIDFAVKYYP